jgi:hypothetical protein
MGGLEDRNIGGQRRLETVNRKKIDGGEQIKSH